jgi:ElaB/YqjD/DUF883 family membrane-anchored ribosome-binding protein
MTEFTKKTSNLGNNILESIKEHPVPTALAGLGIGMLLFGSLWKKEGAMPEEKEAMGESTIGGIKEKMEESRERGREMKGRIMEKAGEWKSAASGYARQMGEAGTEKLRGTGTSMRTMIEEKPLAAIAAALALGAVVGFSIPEMKKEREILTETMH